MTSASAGSVTRPQWKLTDLIGVDALQSIQDTFARAFGLPTVIVDTEGFNATAISNRLAFCEDLTRTSPLGGARCADCDRSAMTEAAETATPAVFECWNGLYDCAIPIAPKGHVVGYFLCGQILTGPPDTDRYVRAAGEIGVEPERYVEALADVSVVSRERYEASVRSMHVLAQMISEQAAASIDSLGMLEQARSAKEDTARLVDELDTILDALRDIGSQPDYPATLTSIAENLARLIPWDSCVIYLMDDERDELAPAVVRDPYPEAVAAYRPRKGRGVIGRAAVTGLGRRFLDITEDPDFEPIPGVPVEAESALVMPMVYKGTVSGVIILSRFERRTFSDHELRLLEVFSSQASVSVQVAKLASENAQRLREERAFGRLRTAMAPRASLESMLGEIADVGLELLGADAAVVRATDAPGRATLAVTGLGREAALALLAELDGIVDRCAQTGVHEIVARDRWTALVLPHGQAGDVAVFCGGRPDSDARIVESLATHASLGVEKVRLHERERGLLLEYKRLSSLATSLLAAADPDEVRACMLDETPAILSADACFLALLDQAPGDVAVELRHGRHTDRRTIALRGCARLASVRLRRESTPARSLFDAWSDGVFGAVGPDAGMSTWLAEPLPLPSGTLGGLFAAWRSEDVAPSAEQRRLLGVLAGSAGTALARFAAYQATDSTLRDRLVELEALASLAQNISGVTGVPAIVDELLAVLCRVGRLDGAMYATAEPLGIDVHHSAGLDEDERSQLTGMLEHPAPVGETTRVPIPGTASQAVMIPMGGGDVLAGIGPGVHDDQRDRVMATVARYGAVALENAHLHDRQREAIVRLEHILSIHETLVLAVLEGRGLPSVAESLGSSLDAEILVLAPQERVLARWPHDSDIDWRPELNRGQSPHTIAAVAGGSHLLAAPAVVEGGALAWIIARTARPPGEVERAAVEYGAVLAALDLLRERTALEVETRLRSGLLEDLLGGEAAPDLIVERALACGYDLRRPSRVFLVEAAADAESIYAAVSGCAAGWSPETLVTLRGGAVVVVMPDKEEDAERRFEDELRATLSASPREPTPIAVGTRCIELDDYAHSYLAARRGLELLRRLGRREAIFSFRESSLEGMLLQSTRPEVVLKFVSRYVEPLAHYDAAHTSELRRTLEIYYDAGGNLEAAARQLHVHVSTLRYRLSRASDLLGVDVRRSPAALDVQVALQAARFLAAAES